MAELGLQAQGVPASNPPPLPADQPRTTSPTTPGTNYTASSTPELVSF